MATAPALPLTEEQYLEIERLAETKSEFYRGQMFAMAGGSPNHSLFSHQIGTIFSRQVPPGCRVFNADLRIRAKPAGLYTYADCSVVYGEPQFGDPRNETITNPVVIVEVLSPSTENYDRGKKLELYRTIESLRDYLIIHQDRVLLEHHSKQPGGGWLLRDHSAPEASFAIDSLGATIPLAELYANVLPPPQTAS